MAQVTITVQVQVGTLDETITQTLSQEHTDALLNGLLRDDTEELQNQYPNQAERAIVLYKQWQKQTHNDLMDTEQRRVQTVTTGWP